MEVSIGIHKIIYEAEILSDHRNLLKITTFTSFYPTSYLSYVILTPNDNLLLDRFTALISFKL